MTSGRRVLFELPGGGPEVLHEAAVEVLAGFAEHDGIEVLDTVLEPDLVVPAGDD